MLGVALDELLDGAPIPLGDLVRPHMRQIPEHADDPRQLAHGNAQLADGVDAELGQPPRLRRNDEPEARAAHLRQIRDAHERYTVRGADAP